MSILTVSIVFELDDRIWVVRRAHTVVKTFRSRDQAIQGACELGVNLRERMYCNLRFMVHDELGDSYLYLSMNDDRTASELAARLLYTCWSHTPGAEAMFCRSPLAGSYSKAKTFLATVQNTGMYAV